VPQLLANEERFIAASLRKLERMRPAAIDINMGCPVSKALKHNWGVALMGDPAYAEEVVRLTVKHSPWPVSVKLRTGLSDDPQYLIDFARMLEQAGAAWLTIHPRIAAQQRRGRPRWEYLARVREAVSIPVVCRRSTTRSRCCARPAATAS
jgi:tRNA-dihydrouridine synthase B